MLGKEFMKSTFMNKKNDDYGYGFERHDEEKKLICKCKKVRENDCDWRQHDDDFGRDEDEKVKLICKCRKVREDNYDWEQYDDGDYGRNENEKIKLICKCRKVREDNY